MAEVPSMLMEEEASYPMYAFLANSFSLLFFNYIFYLWIFLNIKLQSADIGGSLGLFLGLNVISFLQYICKFVGTSQRMAARLITKCSISPKEENEKFNEIPFEIYAR